MATKSGQPEPEKAEVVEDLLEALDTALDRVKVLYEQYFLGIQKQPPTYLHTELERKIRDLVQLQIRNTALRYRFATLQQKYGSYNAYWRRTLRQIEAGTYTRNLSKIGRQVARTGADVPEEILAAMPKRMRDQVRRDRQAALALAERRQHHADEPEFLTLAEEDIDLDFGDLGPALVREPPEIRRSVVAAGGTHKIDESDADFDLDAFFAKVTSEGEPALEPSAAPPARAVPAAQPSALLDPPAIRWRTPAMRVEPWLPLEPRSDTHVAGPPGARSAPSPPGAAGPDPLPPTSAAPSDAPRPPTTGRPGTPWPVTASPKAAPPTVRLRSPGRPITARPVGEGPDTEPQLAGRPSTEPPAAPPSTSAGPLGIGPPAAGPPGLRLPSAGAPTVRLRSPGRPGTDPAITIPSEAAMIAASPARVTAPPANAAPSNAASPIAASPITPSTSAPPPAAPPATTPPPSAPPPASPIGPSPGLPLTGPTRSGSAPPTVRLRGPGFGRMPTVRGDLPGADGEPASVEPPSAARPGGEPPAAVDAPSPPTEPTSTAAEPPPAPPPGGRSIAPILPSVLRPVPSPATPTPRGSGPLPPQLARPSPPKPPAPAPSQATRPLPIVPGASAALAPPPVETLSGTFPRIPSPPTFPAKPRPATEPPAAEDRAPAIERPAPGKDRAAPSSPAPNKP